MRRINFYITAVLLLILFVYLALLDTLAKPLFESQATSRYGAEVSIDSLRISPFVGKVELFQLQVADRGDAMRNLAQADRAYFDIDILQLARDIIEVQHMEIEGLVMFAPRDQPAEILRPLLPEDSAIATATLPRFELPDADALIERQRDKLDADIEQFNRSFEDTRKKWETKISELPDQQDIDAYRDRIRALKKTEGLAGKLAAVQEIQQIYSEVSREVETLRSARQEFRGDLQLMRSQVDAATKLPEKHVNQLVDSLGLSSDQMASLGSRILRGDLNGLFQQVMAPLAFSAAGEIDPDSMPIHIDEAHISGALLPSAAGLTASGELKNFTWPLEIAELPATLKLSGASLDGGSLALDATVDHRGEPMDQVSVLIRNLPLRQMPLVGSEQLAIVLEQSLANVSGDLRIDGENLSGAITQQLTKALFSTQLSDDAGQAARLIARVLEASTEFLMEVGFEGTLQAPRLNYSADMDQLIESTLRSAVSERVGSLTQELQNRISSEIGPEIAAFRAQFAALEQLQAELQANVEELSRVAN